MSDNLWDPKRKREWKERKKPTIKRVSLSPSVTYTHCIPMLICVKCFMFNLLHLLTKIRLNVERNCKIWNLKNEHTFGLASNYVHFVFMFETWDYLRSNIQYMYNGDITEPIQLFAIKWNNNNNEKPEP